LSSHSLGIFAAPQSWVDKALTKEPLDRRTKTDLGEVALKRL
jgi:hypothetical protein